jgi:hypothetical protein
MTLLGCQFRLCSFTRVPRRIQRFNSRIQRCQEESKGFGEELTQPCVWVCFTCNSNLFSEENSLLMHNILGHLLFLFCTLLPTHLISAQNLAHQPLSPSAPDANIITTPLQIALPSRKSGLDKRGPSYLYGGRYRCNGFDLASYFTSRKESIKLSCL